MPATRASSKLPHRHDPFPEVHRNKRKSNSPQAQALASDDVIVLSSSDDEARAAKKPHSNRVTKASHTKPSLQSTEVIEISDDDEDYPVVPVKPSRNLMKITELQSQIDTLKEVSNLSSCFIGAGPQQ